jgi:hypothetical protein
MRTSFEALYDLALDLTSGDTREITRLSAHRDQPREAAEQQLRSDILCAVMPGETAANEWGVVRIFCLNLVNRSQPPVSTECVRAWLNLAEQAGSDTAVRLEALLQAITASQEKGANKIGNALRAFTKKDAVFGDDTCLAWLMDRAGYWKQQRVENLDGNALLKDMKKIFKHEDFKGMGLPLTANLFADIGVPAFAKPDLHVMPIISLLALIEPDHEDVFKAIVEIAKRETVIVAANSKFAWLVQAGGLYPRHLDRLIYLIGSDNRSLNGQKLKSAAKLRRQLMIDTLREREFFSSSYAGVVRRVQRG